MAAQGCSYVVHCYTETDLLYYRATMGEVMQATRDAGLEAWADPWGVTTIFSGESLSRFVADQPDALQLLSDGRRVPAACPNHPETRRFLLDWVTAAAEAGGEVAFWDEPHFYVPMWRNDWSGAWACRCPHCQERFRTFAGGPMPERMDDQVRAFRERSLIELLAELSAAAKRLGMRNALCLLTTDLAGAGLDELAARMEERFRRRLEREGGTPADDSPWRSIGVGDWENAAAIKGLDCFGSDPYWYLFGVEPEPFARAFARRTVETARRHGLDSQLWVQAFAVPEGREEELRDGLRIFVEEGATHLAAWSFRATESMSSIRPARPDMIWQLLGEEFSRMRGA